MSEENQNQKPSLTLSINTIANTVAAAALVAALGFFIHLSNDVAELKNQFQQIKSSEDRARLWTYTKFLHDEIIRLDYKAGLQPSPTPTLP